MTKLKIKTRISYIPGPWGLAKPVPNAKITIHDVDSGGGNDVILQGKTNAQGRFGGLSGEWQDKKRVRYWKSTGFLQGHWAYRTMADPSDVMMLVIKIEADGKTMTGPFPFIGDNVEVPLIVPWGYIPPPSLNIDQGKINGVKFTDFQKLIDKVTKTIEAGQPLKLELSGGWADAVEPLVKILNDPPLDLLKGVFPGSQAGSVILALGAGTTLTISAPAIAAMAAVILAIGALILLSGAAVFVTALGIAVILAITNGYCDISAGQKTVTDANGQPSNQVVLELKKAC